MPNPGPATTITEHPIGGGGSPAYLGVSGGAVGFYQDAYGGGAVTQRKSAFQQVITVSQTAGLLVTFQSNSQKEPTLTAQNISAAAITFTGAPMLSTADVVVVNKQIPLAQYGIAACRVSTASPDKNFTVMILGGANLNTSGLSTTTPTGDQFLFTAFRGSIVNSVTLSPSVVPPNTTVEQQFTVTGLAPGMVVPITKPTEQSGIGLAGTRVPVNNTLALTFINTGNTAVTPTASEVYLYTGLAGAAPISPIMTLGLNMSQAPVLTVSGGALTPALVTVTGIGAFDRVIGIGQNTIAMTAATSVALLTARVSSAVANTLNLTFGNLNTNSAGITANSTDTWTIPIFRQNNEAPVTLYPASFAGATIGPNTCTEVGVTVTGITVSCAVFVSKPSFTSGIGILGYRVSAAATTGSTIGITFGNPTSASIAVPAETYTVAAFKPLFGVGHYTEQMISPLSVQGVALTNEMRNALAGMALIAGA
jgi:hypothetical protein